MYTTTDNHKQLKSLTNSCSEVSLLRPIFHFRTAQPGYRFCLSDVFEKGFLEYVAEFCHEEDVWGHVDIYGLVKYFLQAGRRFCEMYGWDWQCCFGFHWRQLIGKVRYAHQTERGFR